MLHLPAGCCCTTPQAQGSTPTQLWAQESGLKAPEGLIPGEEFLPGLRMVSSCYVSTGPFLSLSVCVCVCVCVFERERERERERESVWVQAGGCGVLNAFSYLLCL